MLYFSYKVYIMVSLYKQNKLPANECAAESSSVPLERTAKKFIENGEHDSF